MSAQPSVFPSVSLTDDRKIAIVAVHGVGPEQRYVTQDTLACELCDQLGSVTGTRWVPNVIYPGVEEQTGEAHCYPSALRVSEEGSPSGTVFDVYEAYWSPIDKGRTSLAAVLMWILKSVFAPLSTSARLPARWSKMLFDSTYVALAIGLLVAFSVGAVYVLLRGYAVVSQTSVTGAADAWSIVKTILSSPFDLIGKFSPSALAALVVTFAGAYLLAEFAAVQLVRSRAPKTRFSLRRGYEQWRAVANVLLLVAGCGLIFGGYALVGGALRSWFGLVAFVVGAILVRLALSLAKDFFVNRLGDVQIYTTRDNNSSYYALREEITQTVQKTIQQVLDTQEKDENGETTGQYERIYVFGHSLGSTIAMDALIHLHQLVEANVLAEDRWRRIRGLITYGTALEKTKFFFDVAHPTISQKYDEWRSEVYGHLFSPDPRCLTEQSANPHQIFWANYWYFHDIVANEIMTYRDDREHGAAIVCENVRLNSPFNPLHLWVHGDYVGDDRMWRGLGDAGSPARALIDVVTARDTLPVIRGEVAPGVTIVIVEDVVTEGQEPAR